MRHGQSLRPAAARVVLTDHLEHGRWRQVCVVLLFRVLPGHAHKHVLALRLQVLPARTRMMQCSHRRSPPQPSPAQDVRVPAIVRPGVDTACPRTAHRIVVGRGLCGSARVAPSLRIVAFSPMQRRTARGRRAPVARAATAGPRCVRRRRRGHPIRARHPSHGRAERAVAAQARVCTADGAGAARARLDACALTQRGRRGGSKHGHRGALSSAKEAPTMTLSPLRRW